MDPPNDCEVAARLREKGHMKLNPICVGVHICAILHKISSDRSHRPSDSSSPVKRCRRPFAVYAPVHPGFPQKAQGSPNPQHPYLRHYNFRVQHQGVQQMSQVHHDMPVSHRRPVQRKGVLVLVTVMLLHQDVFLNAPAVARRTVAAFHHVPVRQWP